MKDFPERGDGEDYVNLAYKSGGEGVIKVILTDIRRSCSARMPRGPPSTRSR